MGFFFVRQRILTNIVQLQRNFQRNMSSSSSQKAGLVLGAFQTPDKQLRLSKLADAFNKEKTGNKLADQIKILGPLDAGSVRVFWNVSEKFPVVAVAGLGNPEEKADVNEEIDQHKENIRNATAAGVRQLIDFKVDEIVVDDMEDGQTAAEGAFLGSYKFQLFRNAEKQKKIPPVKLLENSEQVEAWNRGAILAETQNFCRILSETPANLMTPSVFCDKVREKCAGLKVDVTAHDEKWAEEMKMGSFLSVTRGSKEPAKFLELTYMGDSASKDVICLVGKGVTFDTGGISLKPSAKMDDMRADMGGAANVACTTIALARLGAKVNVKTLIPLCENMPGGAATKPGDLVTAMNGKTIVVDNTDAEGRLILCDALCYAETFNPKYIVDVATLTGAIRIALGDCVSGVFTNDNNLWNAIHDAGMNTGDRVWRMPLFKHYAKQMTDYEGYDINNIGKGVIGAGSCTAAAFLREFVKKDTKWMHCDIAGVMGNCTDQPYTGKGMSGRPLRTLVEFVLREAGHKL
ncbi:cytosol aminopeptidase-like [Culicoides brevitarsis]|uniref:cytosol aminopeptidase-like n=1 Tax=Culicoides brevitarsis TaxID=469753 RepID=UPI00307B1F02